MSKLIESIKRHEGFRSKPYPDPLHGWDVPTFGHGLTYITEEESTEIVKNRIKGAYDELYGKSLAFRRLPSEAQDIVVEMAFQLGVSGVLKFTKMWRALELRDFDEAAKEMLDSRWASQTPSRAEDLSEQMRSI